MQTIYALADRSGDIRYIGQTARALRVRLSSHVHEATRHPERIAYSTAKSKWIRSLSERPTIHALLYADSKEDGDKAETEFIKAFREAGRAIFNVAHGPTTLGVPITDDAKSKMSLAKKGKKQSPEHVAKRIIKKQSPEHIEKRAAANRKPRSPEACERIRLAALLRWAKHREHNHG